MACRIVSCLLDYSGVSALALFLSMCASAQDFPHPTEQMVNDEVATPMPGGHDYQHITSETVNPSNGSVGFRIQYPMPPGTRNYSSVLVGIQLCGSLQAW